MIQPTAEFAAAVSDTQAAAVKERKILAVTFHRLFNSEDGKRVLSFLSDFTSRPVPLEQLPHGAVHKEGQNWLIHEIRTQIAQGEKHLASTPT
jgi:hypothetical protein